MQHVKRLHSDCAEAQAAAQHTRDCVDAAMQRHMQQHCSTPWNKVLHEKKGNKQHRTLVVDAE
jgi:hypothetical protein